MTVIGRSPLLRSLPVLLALFLALFSPPSGTDPVAPHAAIGMPAVAGPMTASCADAERVARTAEASPTGTAGAPFAGPPTGPAAAGFAEPSAGAVPTVCPVPALNAQRTAGVAGSRAPPFAV
jgi:hypothetical protein